LLSHIYRVRPRLVAAMTAALATLLAASAATARTDAATSEPSAATPAAATPKNCTLRPAAHRSARHEWASCLSVSAKLGSAPRVGEGATLRFEVTSQYAADGVHIDADLPGNLRWSGTPAGMRRAALASAAPQRHGRIDRASVVRPLAAGQTVRFEGTVTAAAAGTAEIRVRASMAVPGGSNAAADSVFLTVGDRGASTFGIRGASAAKVTSVTERAAPRAATPHPRRRSVGTAGLPRPAAASDISVQATTCASGGWHYVDNNGFKRPSVNFQVQVWDRDASGGDDLLVTGLTSSAGGYQLCFDNADEEGGGQDVYLVFVSENSNWRVRRTGTDDNYRYTSGTVSNVATDSTTSFGNLRPTDADQMRGLHAFDEANDAWAWRRGSCWDRADTTCRQLVINWAPDSSDGTYYSPGGNDVHLAAADPDAPITVVAQIGHSIMDDAYEEAFPPAPSCSPHAIRNVSSAGCAWTEGWAEWFAATVYHDPFFRWPDGSFQDLETPTWGTAGWANGDTVEGRVAGALIDISDGHDEPFWDCPREGAFNTIWATLIKHVSNSMAQFWSQAVSSGFFGPAGSALACLYQNTIDYGFREPLRSYADLGRPIPTPHNYSFTTSNFYWSVVAVRPPAGADYNLSLFDDAAQSSLLASSASGAGAVDFVAVDSNRREFGDYYPRAAVHTGSGGYRIELIQGSSPIGPASSQAITMHGTDVVVVRDAFLSAGVPVTFTVTAGDPTQDAELFLMASDGANPGTWVRARSAAVRSASANGAGGSEQLSFTPTVSDWYGVVLVNKAGSGTYTLQRS
jgi:hypothetical protein